MIVYLFRHGHAESKSESPDKTDRGRRLTKEGEEQVRVSCDLARKLGTKPTVVLSSPLVRALQTVEISKPILNPRAYVVEDASLEPDGKVQEVYKALSRFKKSDHVLVVTHLPILGHFLADFLDWDAVWRNMEFGSGAMARMDSKTLPKSKSGDLIWILPGAGH